MKNHLSPRGLVGYIERERTIKKVIHLTHSTHTHNTTDHNATFTFTPHMSIDGPYAMISCQLIQRETKVNHKGHHIAHSNLR